ncbi:hypothetical protein [Microbacterium arborescens]
MRTFVRLAATASLATALILGGATAATASACNYCGTIPGWSDAGGGAGVPYFRF